MAIKPREKVEEKKAITQRDDVLAIVAFAAAGGLYWGAGEYPTFEVVLTPLSYVLGGIGIVIILSMLQANARKRADENRKRRRR